MWPFEAGRFAAEYVAELRRLGEGPLIDVGVVDRAVEIDVDKELTWILEREGVGSEDLTNVVDSPQRVYMSTGDGGASTPVLSFRTTGYRGAEISTKVPHFAAFERIEEELKTRLEKRTLPNEGPDIVYERLCAMGWRFMEMGTQMGTRQYEDLAEGELQRLSAEGLLRRFSSVVVASGKVDVVRSDIRSAFVGFVPALGKVVVKTGPEPVGLGVGRRLGVDGGELYGLVERATEFGIEELPLHPLGLLPEGATDPVLSLPSRKELLEGEALVLYVKRHAYGEMRAFRYLVESNLRGLTKRLRKYSMLPWHIEVAVEERSSGGMCEARTRAIIRCGAECDKVTIVSKVVEKDALWTQISTMWAYRGVLHGAYDLLESDVGDLLNGERPLGSDVL